MVNIRDIEGIFSDTVSVHASALTHRDWKSIKRNLKRVARSLGRDLSLRKFKIKGEILWFRSPKPKTSPCAAQPQRFRSTSWPGAPSSCDGHSLTMSVNNAQRKMTNPSKASCRFPNLFPLNPSHVTLSFFNFASSTLFLESASIYILKLHFIFWRNSVPSKTEYIKWCVWNSDKIENSIFFCTCGGVGNGGGGLGGFECALTSF